MKAGRLDSEAEISQQQVKIRAETLAEDAPRGYCWPAARVSSPGRWITIHISMETPDNINRSCSSRGPKTWTGRVADDASVQNKKTKQLNLLGLWLPLTPGSNEDQSRAGGLTHRKLVSQQTSAPATCYIVCSGLVRELKQGFSKLWFTYFKQPGSNVCPK